MSINTFNKTEGTLIPVSTGGGVIAEDVEYNDTQTQFGSTNVQDAIVALAANSGGSPYTYMTQAEYEVLETPDPDTMYWVTYPLSGDHIVWRNGEAVDSKVCENAGFALGNSTYHRYPYSHIAIPSFSGTTVDTPFKYAKYVDIAKGVTNLRSNIFKECTLLESISIPTSVTTIGSSAFYGCFRLTAVTIPDSVTQIDQSTFYGCSGLTTVTIPDSVTTIGYSAFEGCSGLTSVTISNSVTTIETTVFDGCSGLTTVTIPDSVTQIVKSAFEDCSGLTAVSIPNSVTGIGDRVFYNCRALTNFGFRGTKAQWRKVTLGGNWHYSTPFTVVHCTDGDSNDHW